MPEIWDKVKDFLGLESGGTVGYIISLIFYGILVIFIIFWALEIPVKLSKKLFRKPYQESPAKRVSRIAFNAAFFTKFAFFCLSVFLAFAKASGATVFFKKYIKQPENLIELIKSNKVFLIIFGLVLIYEFGFRRKIRGMQRIGKG